MSEEATSGAVDQVGRTDNQDENGSANSIGHDPMTYYADGSGRYLGVFVGGEVNGEPTEPVVPEGAVAVPSQPGDARQIWDGKSWGAAPVDPPVITATAFLDRLGNDGQALMAIPAFSFMLVRLCAAGSVALTDSAVITGMQGAVDAKIITQQRAAELLAAP